MEAVEKIKEATFDINTIGLYDAEKDRKWKEEAKLAYREKIGVQKGREEGIELGREEERLSIISTLLNNGMSQEEIFKMTGISL